MNTHQMRHLYVERDGDRPIRLTLVILLHSVPPDHSEGPMPKIPSQNSLLEWLSPALSNHARRRTCLTRLVKQLMAEFSILPAFAIIPAAPQPLLPVAFDRYH